MFDDDVLDHLTEGERKQWFQHPVTKQMLRQLVEQREDLKEQWANGQITEPTVEGTAMRNAQHIAFCQMLDSVIDTIREAGGVEE